ncbi:uncharacterized protein LOC113232843 [Hyposmocoma kahamanoa]|uniref:uncharacterized protein LOC113232843 n=1 Tax=Hyposmocoma kahamanoa TaxID=1477025 RepID=UPI000E6D878D|nr:uncharacterized protein LOC113232843 [Hyposmocoma kahamanoa]
MPQTFQVLRCYKCLTFQVHITKKANKFECKLCGEKQSIKRHYGFGTAKECRIHVQKLNGIRGEIDVLKETTYDDEFDNKRVDVQLNIENSDPKKSKWTDFVGKLEDTPAAGLSESMFLNAEVVLEVTKEVRKLGKRNNFKCPFISKSSNNNEHDIDNNRESCAKKEMDSYRLNASFPFSRQLHETNGNANFINSIESIPIKIESTIDQMDKRAPKKFLTPVVNNSKWAQFVETEVESEDQNDFYDTSETIEDENNDNLTSKDNTTKGSEHHEKYNFCIKNNKSSLFKTSYALKRKSEQEKNKNLSNSSIPNIAKQAQIMETDKIGSKDTPKIEYDHVQNPVTANTLFALCEDSELDKILDI